ncbi:hypothetical protein GCM10023210_28380 [Chryseobacterium ginsengisoli]|uniref:HTH luxR-type domain-containing protein n=1 Tax=Chryseobacterium ginsengisoli TaxID=363853 RepID=A0ABP9MIB4_9FLAO
MFPITAQKTTTAEIDTLQKQISKIQWNIGDYRKGVLLQKEIIEKSKRIKYTKGEITGYLGLAHALGGMNKNQESFYFLNIAEKKLKSFDDNPLKARLYFLYGTYYYRLELHQQAIKSFNKSLDFANKIQDKKLSEKLKYNVYDWKRSSFESLNQMDSVYSNERKCMASPMPMLYITIASRHLDKGEIDSAKYYTDKANDLVLAKKAPIEGKSNVLRAYGKLYIKKKEYDKALKCLFESLEITKKMNFKKRDLESYKLIYEAYKGQNDLQKENEYLLKYSALNDSLNQVEKQMANLPIEKLLNDQAEENEKSKNSLYYIIIGVTLISLFIICMLIRFFNQKQKENDTTIHQKVQETDLLKKKLDTAIDEVIHLAITDDPSFIVKFKEVYSEFYTTLRSEYPQLTVNDMKFFALIKLKFSNKEIAEYAHMSIRTVESKKYRLRKKIDLATDVDFNNWVLSR